MTQRSLADLRRAFKPRADADWKVSGQKGFLTDRIPLDALAVGVWRSPIAHGRILAVDTSEAKRLPGVVCVATAADVPGHNGYGAKVRDQPVLCADRVRMIGDPVVAVAALTPDAAAHAVAAIRVVLEPLPVIDDPAQALEPGACPIHPAGNLCYERRHVSGDIEAAFARSALSVSETYDTGRQFHIAMETEGGFVVPRPDGSFAVHVASHFPHGDRRALAAIIDVDPTRIEVTASPIGGSFGGKDTLSVQPILILLAFLSGRTVGIHRTRTESILCGETRHPFRIRMTTSCDAAGRLLGHRVALLADTGAYTTKGPDVLDTAFENAPGPYAFDAVDILGQAVFTNNGNAGAFRGFGAVQAQFALEQQIDRLAVGMGIDVARFREINLRPLDRGPLGQVTTGALHPSRALAVTAGHMLRHQESAVSAAEDRFVRGVGLSLITKGEGFSKGGPNAGSMALSLSRNGRIVAATSAVEMGQGAISAAVEAVTSLLGVGTADVEVRLGSSHDPDAGPSAASRVTGVLYRGAALAAPAFRAALLDIAGRVLERPIRDLRLGEGGIWQAAPGRNHALVTFRQLAESCEDLPYQSACAPAEETPTDMRAHGDFNAASALACVTVDRWTGRIKVDRMVVATACGPVLSPLAFVGQVEGGAVMGLGMALVEHMPEAAGSYAHRNLDGYMVPTIADAPDIDVIALEDVESGDRLGPRGIGEISINVAVPAIANAVADALGVPIRCLPVRPTDVLAALASKGVG